MSSRTIRLAAVCTIVVLPVMAAAGQSSVAVSPFVSYIPSAATNPLAGFALTFGGTTGLALRSGAEMSISNPTRDSLAAGGYRPWGADADAMLFLGGLGGGATVFSRALSPYVFAGIGLTGADSAGKNVVQHGWSYGAGVTLPLGMDADLFGEARWRLSEYVLPTSHDAPDSKMAMRFGLSFHVGGGGASPAPRPRGRRHRDVADGGSDVEYVVTPAPAPNVVVVQPAPAPAPEVVVVEQEPAPSREEVVIVERERSPETEVVTRQSERVIGTRESSPTLRRPPARVTPRRSTVVTRSETRSTTRVQAGGAARARARVIGGAAAAGARRAAQATATVRSSRGATVTTRARTGVSPSQPESKSTRPAATSSRSRRTVTVRSRDPQ